MDLFTLITGILVAAKVIGLADISWLLAFSPLLISLGVSVALSLIIAIVSIKKG